MGSDTQTSHPGHAGAPQVVKTPFGDTRYRIEFALRCAEVLKRMRPHNRKYEFALLVRLTQHGDGLIRQMHDVRLGILCSQVGEGPHSARKIDLVPNATRGLLAA